MSSAKKTLIIQAEVQITLDGMFRAITGVLADIPATTKISINFAADKMRAALRRKLRHAGYIVSTDRATGAIKVTRSISASSAPSALKTPGGKSA